MINKHIEMATELRRALPDAFIQADFDAVIAAFNKRIEELKSENKQLIRVNRNCDVIIRTAEAQLEKVRGLPEKWRRNYFYGNDEQMQVSGVCADELQAILENEDAD